MTTKKQKRSPKRGNYLVGYGKPPVASRFQPGRSGNPQGRPKQRQTCAEILERALNERVSVNVGGSVVKITRLEAMTRVHINKAMQGHPHSSRLLVTMMKDAGLPTSTPQVEQTLTINFVGPDDANNGH